MLNNSLTYRDSIPITLSFWSNLKNLSSYESNPMNIDSNSAAITGLTQGQPGVGTKIFVRWGLGRTSEVRLSSIEVTYLKKSKLTSNKISLFSADISNFKLHT